MLDLGKLRKINENQPLDKNAVLDQYRMVLGRLDHMSEMVEALKKSAAKDMKALETTRFSDEKISRAYEFSGLATEVCDSANYDVRKTYDNFDESLKKRFIPFRKFFKGLKKHALKRDIVVCECPYDLDNISHHDNLYFRVKKGNRDMLVAMGESYKHLAKHILLHLHDETEEEIAFENAVGEIEDLLNKG